MDQVEIVIVDWGSNCPLSQSLAISPEAKSVCRFLFVPQEATKHAQNHENTFHQTRAWNVALRRAKGRFVFLSNADQLMPRNALNSLLQLLNWELHVPVDIENILMLMPRLQIPWQLCQRNISLEEWDRYFFFNEYAVSHEPVPPLSYVFGSSAGFVFSKKLGEQLRGMDETQSGWGWSDIEFCFRAVQAREFVYLSNLGIYQFHMEHPPAGKPRADKRNILTWSKHSQANDSNWGLGDLLVIEQKAVVEANPTELFTTKGWPTDEFPSFSQAISEILSEKTMQHVSTVLRKLHHDDFEEVGAKLCSLQFLAWYVLHRYPRKYLELGAMEADGYGIVASGCPSAEVCGIESLQGFVSNGLLHSFFDAITGLGLRSHFRIINSDPKESVQRLKNGSGGAEFDLIYLRREKLFPYGVSLVESFLEILSKGGSLIVCAEERPISESELGDLRALSKRFPSELYRSSDNSAAMIVTSPAGSNDCFETGKENVIDFAILKSALRAKDRGRVRPQSLKKRLIRKIWRTLEKLKTRYAERL
jgi:hypothetical protein